MPWRRERQPTPVFLPGESHGKRSLAGYSPWGCEDLNQTPYDYTVEVTNKFKVLDLIDRVPEELWTEVCDIVQEAVIKTAKKMKFKKQNVV